MSRKSTIKAPEILVFTRAFLVGFIGSEVVRLIFYLIRSFASTRPLTQLETSISMAAILVYCSLIYIVNRDIHLKIVNILRSRRVDLLLVLVIGVYSNELALPWLNGLHKAFESVNSNWAPTLLFLYCVVLLSPVIQPHLAPKRGRIPQQSFISDEEIDEESDDLLNSGSQVESFAEAVLASDTVPGLVFGVDGPWGVGKTSFINLVERYWARANDDVIVCRFEPLRYASEPDLTNRLIRTLSTVIKSNAFEPEFGPTVSRYSRLIRGGVDISFMGFKISLEPPKKLPDRLLDDIDDVLRRIGRRVIIIIDDLDRLDLQTINSILFATRRALRLSQVIYVLCYDTEVLVKKGQEALNARQFLEKFVVAKISLFVDGSGLCKFLRYDWSRNESQLASVPSDTMIKLGSVLSKMADMLEGEYASSYFPLVGNLRQVKRFVNMLIFLRIENTDLGRTDFNESDLINLVLLYLYYPGLFRWIYMEETESRSGTFSLKRKTVSQGAQELENAKGFKCAIGNLDPSAQFLLRQLFDLETLGFGQGLVANEFDLRSRACFNDDRFRTLERYLTLIVRFARPDPRDTFVLYDGAVKDVLGGASISSVLTSTDFILERGEDAHDQFWRILINRSSAFDSRIADDAIDTLMAFLPRYSVIGSLDQGLRRRSIYSLLRLLDRVGWDRTSGRGLSNDDESIVRIAHRVFGENSYQGKGLIERLVDPSRGVLGWADLMLFRLQCSADRQAQLYNICRALIIDQDKDATTSGPVAALTVMEMRRLSQVIFVLFKREYIDRNRNFLSKVDGASDEEFLGEALVSRAGRVGGDHPSEQDRSSLADLVGSARSFVKSFVVYQLSNINKPTGVGVGCGYYDEVGEGDNGGIATMMNKYLFGFCFNPDIQSDNSLLFLDHCLMHMTNSFLSGGSSSSYTANRAELPGGLDPVMMGCFWKKHRGVIKECAERNLDRRVLTNNYIASYSSEIVDVYKVLDELAGDDVTLKS